MESNLSKCYSMTVTLNRNKIRTNYHINEELIENVNSYEYLGVYINSKMQWNKTVDLIVSKANKALGLQKAKFLGLLESHKGKMISLSRLFKLEYSCEVCSPSSRE